MKKTLRNRSVPAREEKSSEESGGRMRRARNRITSESLLAESAPSWTLYKLRRGSCGNTASKINLRAEVRYASPHSRPEDAQRRSHPRIVPYSTDNDFARRSEERRVGQQRK